MKAAGEHKRKASVEWHPFERALAVMEECLEFEFHGLPAIPWSDFVLNPMRVRGSDFLMRWSQGEWSEKRLTEAVNDTGRYAAFAYGPSSVAPEGDFREYEMYFERLKAAGLGKMKRPDLLIVKKSDEEKARSIIDDLGGESELPFTVEEEQPMKNLLALAVIAVEAENSMWITRQMKDFSSPLRKQRRLGGELGLPKNAVLPTIIIKEEDRLPLRAWQEARGVPIHVWHAFYDLAFGIAFDAAEGLIASGKVDPEGFEFQAPGGATTKKAIYKFNYHLAYSVGETIEEAKLISAHIVDKSGHVLPYVKFEGGSMLLSPEALQVLDDTARPEHSD